MKGYIHSIETFGAVDGPGIRYVVFMQGCPLRCIYCHNPDSWKIKTGRKISVNRLVKDIKSYINYIADGGVTFSGGEPLLQSKFLYKVIKKLKKINVNVAIDTAGSIPLSLSKKTIDISDLILLDIKSLDNKIHKSISTSTNENTLVTLDYCEKLQKPVWIRHVIVPGYTLNTKHLQKLAEYLTQFRCIKNIELLPFHKMGEYKWKNLKYDYKLYNTPAPTKKEMEQVKEIFKDYNLPIK